MSDTLSSPFGSAISALTGRPLCRRLIEHVLEPLSPSRRRSAERAYRTMPLAYFDDVEQEILHTMAASDSSLDACLGDMDAFNALTPETENDAWYEQARAFTSMHLDALLLGFSRRRLMCTLDQLLVHARAAKTVLEVGSGSGRLAALMADAAPDWRFTLVDRSAQAVRFATAAHRARGTSARVNALEGDLASLPMSDESVDIVVAAEVLEHAPEPERSARELLRVLRPGGFLAISLPIDLDIAMHPTVFRSEADILEFFGGFALTLCESVVVAPDPEIDAITEVFPGFAGCVNAVFRKNSG